MCFLALALSSCAVSSSPFFASGDLPAGYPVFVTIDTGACSFQVQDMILKSSGLSEWMTQLPDKSWQIDLVIIGERQACIRRAEKIVRSAGFTRILLRRSGDAEYSSGLPPI